ncbi:hypothetical protein [Microtetraspora sp. NBRC 13810]|uniref:hypothetical protein n=1 Tax=Microtetraspora sp. NBRC 13810 TaxID=3030990 RepID=UPI00255479BF|nr:hypothetical protein [Microtetraspora sp. NBRC 13810]
MSKKILLTSLATGTLVAPLLVQVPAAEADMLEIRSVTMRPATPVVGPSNSVRMVIDVVVRGASGPDGVTLEVEPAGRPGQGTAPPAPAPEEAQGVPVRPGVADDGADPAQYASGRFPSGSQQPPAPLVAPPGTPPAVSPFAPPVASSKQVKQAKHRHRQIKQVRPAAGAMPFGEGGRSYGSPRRPVEPEAAHPAAQDTPLTAVTLPAAGNTPLISTGAPPNRPATSAHAADRSAPDASSGPSAPADAQSASQAPADVRSASPDVQGASSDVQSVSPASADGWSASLASVHAQSAAPAFTAAQAAEDTPLTITDALADGQAATGARPASAEAAAKDAVPGSTGGRTELTAALTAPDARSCTGSAGETETTVEHVGRGRGAAAGAGTAPAGAYRTAPAYCPVARAEPYSADWQTWRFVPEKALDRWYPAGRWTVTATARSAEGGTVVRRTIFFLKRETTFGAVRAARIGAARGTPFGMVRVEGVLNRVDPKGVTDYAPFPGQRVEILYREPGGQAWSRAGLAVTGRTGRFTREVPGGPGGMWRFRYPGSAGHAPSFSTPRRVA